MALDGPFDVLTGGMFLHEIMHEVTPRLLERLQRLLAEGGFLGKPFPAMGKVLTSLQAATGRLDNWSYCQSIYASQTVPRSLAFPPGFGRAR